MNERSNDADFSAVAAIYKGDKIYLAQRNSAKVMFPGQYEAPGGHVQIGEDFYSALHREISEELHVTVEIEGIVDVYTFESEGIWKAEVMFLCKPTQSEEPILNKEDHQSGGWFNKQDLEDIPIVGLLKRPLEKAFDMIGEK